LNLPTFLAGLALGMVLMFVGLCYLLGWVRREGLLFIDEDLEGCIIVRPKGKPIIDLEEHL